MKVFPKEYEVIEENRNMGKFMISYEKRIEVMKLLDQGKSHDYIAENVGISRSSVNNIKKGGMEEALKAKNQRNKTQEIVKLLESGMKQKDIIKKVGTNRDMIARVNREYGITKRTGKNTITEEQLKIWAYIHQRYGTDREEM